MRLLGVSSDNSQRIRELQMVVNKAEGRLKMLRAQVRIQRTNACWCLYIHMHMHVSMSRSRCQPDWASAALRAFRRQLEEVEKMRLHASEQEEMMREQLNAAKRERREAQEVEEARLAQARAKLEAAEEEKLRELLEAAIEAMRREVAPPEID